MSTSFMTDDQLLKAVEDAQLTLVKVPTDGTPPPPYVSPSDDDFRIFATNNDRPIFQGDRLRCSDFMRGYATKIANIESLIASLVAVKAARATME